jgi:hypothetical protein
MTDGQLASSSSCPASSRTDDQILIYSSDNYILCSSCKAPSLTRGWVCNLQCNHVLVMSHRTHSLILLSHLRLSKPGGPGPRMYNPQEEDGPVKSQSHVTTNGPRDYRGAVFEPILIRN